MGINNLRELFNERWSDNLEGGILESLGRLFRHSVKLYIYPMQAETYRRFMEARAADPGPDVPTSGIIDAEHVPIAVHLRSLYAYLLENGNITEITGFDPTVMPILADDVRRLIQLRDPSWSNMVPPSVATAIRRRGLFGCPPSAN